MAQLDKARSFTKFIKDKILGFPAGRAAMKRVLRGDHQSIINAFRYVAPFHPKEGWEESVYMLVGALMALHPKSLNEDGDCGLDFGCSMAILANQTYGKGPDRRFETLLRIQSFDILRDRLRTLVMLLKRDGIGVDWPLLLRDLLEWNSDDRHVQKDWARSYYSRLNQLLNA